MSPSLLCIVCIPPCSEHHFQGRGEGEGRGEGDGEGRGEGGGKRDEGAETPIDHMQKVVMFIQVIFCCIY